MRAPRQQGLLPLRFVQPSSRRRPLADPGHEVLVEDRTPAGIRRRTRSPHSSCRPGSFTRRQSKPNQSPGTRRPAHVSSIASKSLSMHQQLSGRLRVVGEFAMVCEYGGATGDYVASALLSRHCGMLSLLSSYLSDRSAGCAALPDGRRPVGAYVVGYRLEPNATTSAGMAGQCLRRAVKLYG